MRFISKSISLFILAGLGFWPQSPHVWPIPWCRGRCNALSSAYDAALSREHAAQRRVAKDSRCWEAVWEMISVGGDEQLATGITRYNSVYAMEKYVSHIHKPRTGPGSSYSDESSRVIDSWIINSPICIHNLVQTHLISLVIYPTIYIPLRFKYPWITKPLTHRVPLPHSQRAFRSHEEAERIEQVKQNRHAQKLNDILLLGL